MTYPRVMSAEERQRRIDAARSDCPADLSNYHGCSNTGPGPLEVPQVQSQVTGPPPIEQMQNAPQGDEAMVSIINKTLAACGARMWAPGTAKTMLNSIAPIIEAQINEAAKECHLFGLGLGDVAAKWRARLAQKEQG